MRQPKQQYLSGFEQLGVKEFGGSLLRGNPRQQRPIAIKRPMHLIMRSSFAKGSMSFLAPSRAKKIKHLVHRLGELKKVRVYRYANSGNHLHLIVLPRSREAFRAYLRAITGLIARMTMGAERGSPKGKRFWDARPYTRIIEWGKEFNTVAKYLMQNTLEALGFIPYRMRNYPKQWVGT